MKLKRACIKGLNDKVDCNIEFHDDINIVTGINGSGKTTLLKMLWYAISGNIERLTSETSFESFSLETSHYSLSLAKEKNIIKWEYFGIDGKKIHEGLSKNGSILNDLIIQHKASSLFFPTFRRMEGGYSMNFRNARLTTSESRVFRHMVELRGNDNLKTQDELDKLSQLLTVLDHKFICSISTDDLVRLLITRHAEISEKINEYSLVLNNSLVNQIESIKLGIDEDNKQESLSILSQLQQEITTVNDKREQLLQPFKVLSELVTKVLHYKGVKLNNFTLGDSIDAIDSKLLSAGEQQMFSFLCYNAFYENSVIFIDEPELSLHPDWQRRLFPNLMKQQSSNQFIVATHSPFIYSKYADKEIILSQEKGE